MTELSDAAQTVPTPSSSQVQVELVEVHKSIFASKTFWLGVINIIAGILALAAATPDLLTPEVLKWCVFGEGILIVILRYVTTSSVYIPGAQASEQVVTKPAQVVGVLPGGGAVVGAPEVTKVIGN